MRFVIIVLFFQLSFQVKAQIDSVYTSIDDALKNPENVYRLNLEGQDLTVFPQNIGMFKNLVELDLDGNMLAEIPDEIGLLKNLEILSCSAYTGSELEMKYYNIDLKDVSAPLKVSEAIYALTNLKWIDFQGRKIGSLSEKIGQLENLYYLNITDCGLKEIPTSITKLKTQYERIYYNDDTDFFDEYERKLEILAAQNPLNAESVRLLLSIETLGDLDLSGCGITTLPENVLNSQKLNSIKLNNNELTKMPTFLIIKDGLWLELADNQITGLGQNDIDKILTLRFLDLSNNALTPSDKKRLEPFQERLSFGMRF